MARMILQGNPTLDEWATVARRNTHLSDVKSHHVVAAAHRRGVPLVRGRIDAKHAPDIYFGLMEVMGLK